MKRRVVSFICALLMPVLCSCAAGEGAASEVSVADIKTEDEAVSDGAKEGLFAEALGKGVRVSVTTDKNFYSEGDEVSYTLKVENSRANWTAAQCTIQIRTADGLLAADDLDIRIPQLKTGESAEISGSVRVEASAKGRHIGAARSNESSAEIEELRPYIQIPVEGGEARTLRFLIDLPMVQLIMQIPAENRHAPSNVTVHDPSIFKDADGKYYIVGTHITSARSDDLFDWEQTDDSFKGALSDETRERIREYNADETAGSWNGYLWAPDIIYNKKMGKYCVYLSANGDHWQSNIVLLTGDSVEGPFEYAGSVVYGGFTEENWTQTDAPRVLKIDELPERYIQYGVKNSHWGDMFPNCIDPCVFYDEEGELFMSYGSWSGGIFLLKLDEETGLRDYSIEYPTELHSDAYFGTLIAGGAYVSGEGSYIRHIGDWYWLFISYGNLEARGGYNIRVFRAKEPEGPYFDELGNTPFYDEYRFNYNESTGIRLFGGYKWRVMSEGQVAQGHNSALVDDDGRAYIVYHTRTTNGSEGHFVQVHQLFLNKEGWLVAAPYRTDGERLPESGLGAEKIEGDYEIILHRLDIDYADYGVNRPENITLEADGAVSGDYSGSWSAEKGTPYITLSLDAEGTAGDIYSGVALEMEIDGTDIKTPVFTALGAEGQLALWGSRSIE